MRFRKLTALALVAGFALAACGGDDSDSASTEGSDSTAASSGEEIAFTPVTDDTLTIVTSLPGPGFWDGGDSPEDIDAGYEYQMAKAMQAKLGLANLEVKNVDFAALVAGQIQDYDIALSQVTITDERKKVVNFSDPYWQSDQGVLVQAGTTVASLEDAKKLKWGLQTGTTGELYVTDTVQPDDEPQVFQDLASAFTALRSGQVDAVAMDTAIVLPEAARSNGELEVAAQFKTGESYGAILPKDGPAENLAAVNRMLADFEADGSLGKWAAESLGADPSQVPVIG